MFESSQMTPFFVRIRNGDHLGGSKLSNKVPRFAEFKFLNKHRRQKQFLRNERRRVDLQKAASDFFLIFTTGFSNDPSSSVISLPLIFGLRKMVTMSLGKN